MRGQGEGVVGGWVSLTRVCVGCRKEEGRGRREESGKVDILAPASAELGPQTTTTTTMTTTTRLRRPTGLCRGWTLVGVVTCNGALGMRHQRRGCTVGWKG